MSRKGAKGLPGTGGGSSRPGTVLIVDDETALLETLAEYLTQHGYRVETAADSQTALDQVIERSYDAILCDIRMPGLHGGQLFREITDRRPELADRFLFATGATGDELAGYGLDQSSVAILHKPFSPNQLLNTLNSLVDRR